ncbi:MAG TPA: CHAD domain-containing protein [Bryobacteraceae bacterium]|nr:CHAD domain-containing protein [Bryobacteraceae bacterium]
MQQHVHTQTATLLRRFAYQVSRAAKSCDEESVHDLRVAIRRLNRCLQVFAKFFPGNSAKKIRRRLKSLMEAAGQVRDLDIAMELVAHAGVDRKAALSYRMADARRQARRNLLREVRLWKGRGFSKKWRTALGLNA